MQRPCRGRICRRFCVVNVKLTMRLAIGAQLLGSAHCNARSLFSSGARGCYTGGVKQFGRRAGRGGDVARFPWRASLTSIEGGFSQSPPFFLCNKPASADRVPDDACKLSMAILSFSPSDQRRRRPVSTTSRRSTWVLRLSLSIRTVLNTALHSARRPSAEGYAGVHSERIEQQGHYHPIWHS